MRFFLLFLLTALKIFSLTAEDLRQKAITAKNIGNYPEALENYRLSLQKNPYYLPAMVEYGETLLELGYLKEAKEIAERAQKINSENREAFILHIKSLLALEENSLAQTLLDKKIEKYPEEVEYLFLLSQIYFKNEQIFLAKEKLRQILKRDPGHLPSYLLLAEAHSKEGRFDLAEKELNHALKIKPENPDILLTKADIAFREALHNLKKKDFYGDLSQNFFQKPISYYENALNFTPHKISTNMSLVELYILNNQCKETLPLLDRVLQVNPQYFLASYLKGYCFNDFIPSLYPSLLRQEENNDLLRHAYQRYLLKNPQAHGGSLLQQAKYHLNEAKKLYQENLIEKFFYEIKWSLKLYPDLPEAYEILLEHFRSQNDFINYENTLRWLRQNSKKKIYQDLWEKWLYERKENLSFREGLWEKEKYLTRIPIYVFAFNPFDIRTNYPDAGESLAEKIEFALDDKVKVKPLPKETLKEIQNELKKIPLWTKPAYYNPRTTEIILSTVNQKISQENLPPWQIKELQLAVLGEYKVLPNGISFLAKLLDLKSGLSLKEMRGTFTGKGYLRDSALAIAKFVEENIPLSGHIIKISQNHAVFNIGKKAGIKKGQKVKIQRQGKAITELSIKKVDLNYSWAELPFFADQKPLQKGDVVIPLKEN